MARETHSSGPGTFQRELTTQPHHTISHNPRARLATQTSQQAGKAFRRWARREWLAWRGSWTTTRSANNKSDSDSNSSSRSSTTPPSSIEGPTLIIHEPSIGNADDILIVKNPNPHTGLMSPSVLSVALAPAIELSAYHEAPVPASPRDTSHEQSASRKGRIRRLFFGKDRSLSPKIPRESPVEPAEEVHANHIDMPAPLPPMAVTSFGTDLIATWVTEQYRRVYELPDGQPTTAATPRREPRDSAAKTPEQHPIQPSSATPAVGTEARLNGTGKQRLAIKPDGPDDGDTVAPAQASSTKRTKAVDAPTRSKSTAKASAAPAATKPPPATKNTSKTLTPLAAANATRAARHAAVRATVRVRTQRRANADKPTDTHAPKQPAAPDGKVPDQPLFTLSKQDVVLLGYSVLLAWAVVSLWYILTTVAGALVVVLWPIKYLLQAIIMLLPV